MKQYYLYYWNPEEREWIHDSVEWDDSPKDALYSYYRCKEYDTIKICKAMHESEGVAIYAVRETYKFMDYIYKVEKTP